ncbi:hypothetical protein OUZ56_016137 [Daphnia magna]|uniref:Uncharacterized protein n=1 Tax=Daphnia magna TaxID=35525 RepID=A0ABR0APS4_9CRUS|nr:hypothetical protein OUZ56_016137 [Daphnia magna]
MLNSGVNKTGYIETCSFKCVRQSKGEAAQCSTTACDVDRSTGGGGGFIRFGHMIRRRQTRLYGQSCCYIDPDGPKNICMSCYTCKSTQSYMDSDQLGAIGVLGLFHRIN